MSDCDINMYCAELLANDLESLAHMVLVKCTNNDKLNIILSRGNNINHIIKLHKNINMYEFIFTHTNNYFEDSDMSIDDFSKVIDVVSENKINQDHCSLIYRKFEKTNETYYYVLKDIEKFKIICDKIISKEIISKISYNTIYETFLIYILRMCAVLNYNESYEYLYGRIISTPQLQNKLNMKCHLGIYTHRNGNSITQYGKCEYCEYKLSTYECIMVQSLYHPHDGRLNEDDIRKSKNPEIFRRILNGEYTMSDDFIDAMKNIHSKVYFPYFANIILKQKNVDMGIIDNLFDIFFGESVSVETLGNVCLLKVFVMKKLISIDYYLITDILKMEYYNYNKRGSYTTYAHSLGLVDFNQINMNERDCIQFVMKKLII